VPTPGAVSANYSPARTTAPSVPASESPGPSPRSARRPGGPSASCRWRRPA